MRSFRERRPWLVGSVSIALVAAGVVGAFYLPRLQGLRGVYAISADLVDAAGLQRGNEVRVAGVKVGQVTEVTLRPGAARIHMEVRDDMRLPVETRAAVKLKTILGQKFVDLQFPRAYLTAASAGSDPSTATRGFLRPGDVIPRSHTSVPFDIYQAASATTAKLRRIDKDALRKLFDVLAGTAGAAKDQVRRALVDLGRAGRVLSDKGPAISTLLSNARKVSGTFAAGGRDIQGILSHGAEVLGTLAEQRRAISTLLVATNHLGRDLGLLIRAARGPIEVGTAHLSNVLAAAKSEMATLETALEELPTAQAMFARPARFGPFIEGEVCAVISEDTCYPSGTPANPGLPVQGQQPGTTPPATAAPRALRSNEKAASPIPPWLFPSAKDRS